MVNFIRGGGELFSFEYLCFPNSFMNSMIIYLNPHITSTLDFFIVDRVSISHMPVPGGDSP